jgi:hypothetical protein
LKFALRYVRGGKRVGNPGSGRGRMDLWSHRARRSLGFRLISLASATRQGELRSWVANDRRSTPADHAAFLIDFAAWLGQLPERRRLSAVLLSQGYGTKEVALQVGVTPAAISQARTELARNWASFQGIGRCEGSRCRADGREPFSSNQTVDGKETAYPGFGSRQD